MKKKISYVLVLPLILFLTSVFAAAPSNTDGGYKPYPVIDLTNGIPPWVNNYNNDTQSAPQKQPQGKGEYVSSFDNTTQDGKIYYQAYSQTDTGVTIATVPKGKKNEPKKGSSSKTVTYGTDKH